MSRIKRFLKERLHPQSTDEVVQEEPEEQVLNLCGVCRVFFATSLPTSLPLYYQHIGITLYSERCQGCVLFKAYIGERPECEDKINEKPVTTISRKFNGGALVIGAVDGSPPKELYCLPDLVYPWGTWPGLTPAYHLPRNASQAERDERLRGWLKTCHTKHNCLPEDPPLLPSRVLDIGKVDGELISILESNNIKQPYVCLSYCWGDGNPLKLTTENLSRFKAGIDFQSLPQLFRDFIELAKTLGIRYVWIDSLCILQDSLVDWEEQAAQMAQVYGNSYLTIAASSATSCLSHLNILPPRSEPVEVFDFVYAREPRHVDGYPDTKTSKGDPCPLDKRGWAYQEYLLSPRVLHFTSDEMVWHCNEALCCECRCEPQPVTAHNGPRAMLKSLFQGKPLPLTEITKAWHVCIEQYSLRYLTQWSDVLPALSGVAQIFQSRMDSNYLAGMWETSILNDICWRYVPTAVDMTGNNNPSSLTEEYISPSWSWSAVRGPVQFHPHAEEADFQMAVHEILTRSSLHDPFGGVSAGHMIVKGWTFPIALGIRQDLSLALSPDFQAEFGSMISIPVKYNTSTLDDYSTIDRKNARLNVWALVIRSWRTRYSTSMKRQDAVIMLLERLAGSSRYIGKRVGTLWDVKLDMSTLTQKTEEIKWMIL